MHHWRRFTVLALCIVLTWFAFGCDDDDDDSPTGGGGGTLDTEFDVFRSEFQGVEEGTGEMLGLVFIHIGDIQSLSETPRQDNRRFAAKSINYHGDSKFWVVHDTMIDGDTMIMVDSLQLIEDTDTVQWFNQSQITEIRTFTSITFRGDGLTSAGMSQNLVLTTEQIGSDTIIVNGTGAGLGDIVDTSDDGPDTTVCETYIDADWTLTDALVDVSGEMDGPPCPYSGTLVYTADVNISCTGSLEGTTSGTWGLTLTFDNGEIRYLYEKGGSSWPVVDSCY